MNRIFLYGKKLPIIVGMSVLALVIAASFSIFIGKAQAAPAPELSMDTNYVRSGYCSASRSLVYKALRQRMDFALSDGRGNALGLRDGSPIIEGDIREINLNRLDFSLADGRGNALGVRGGYSHQAFPSGEIQIRRLDFALSDGRGNGLGLRDGSYALLNNVLAAICQ